MSAHMHIANNYNDVVDVITSLIAIYARTISVEPTIQQAINKRQEHTQIASKLYHSLLPMLYGCNAIELSDLQAHYNDLKRTFLDPSQLTSNILEHTELSIQIRKPTLPAEPY
jgi:hypothetical protein